MWTTSTDVEYVDAFRLLSMLDRSTVLDFYQVKYAYEQSMENQMVSKNRQTFTWESTIQQNTE